jgi:glutamate synthase domain-containing protein 1
MQMPHAFFAKVAAGAGIDLPEAGAYGTGLIFLPQDAAERRFCKDAFNGIITGEGATLLGWREVPVDASEIGKTARKTAPWMEQVFIAGNGAGRDGIALERKLYVIRRKTEKALKGRAPSFYITNLSSRTYSYKGLLMPGQVERFFLDLRDASLQSSICLVHSRYSTNTFPTWDLAQPFRFLAHNGEINTLRGNVNWMRAREGL